MKRGEMITTMNHLAYYTDVVLTKVLCVAYKVWPLPFRWRKNVTRSVSFHFR